MKRCPALVLVLVLVLVLAASSSSPAFAATPPPGYAALDGARAGTADLAPGSKGAAVTALQTALDALGDGLARTGVFDAPTEAAVKAFQRKAGLTADGIVGPRTVAALDRALGLAQASGTGPSRASLPARPAGALAGSAFIAATDALSRPAREARILDELSRGNLPDFERAFVAVTVYATGPSLAPHVATYRVAPDYLAIGSDADFVRMPMDPLTAQRLCDLYGCSLPTRRMVDQISRAAAVRLAPIPQTPGPQMMSNAYFARHQALVQAAFDAQGGALGALTDGDKKDVVVSNLLLAHPDRVAIYGWHRLDGTAIQPLSTVHENTYADYSHGVRLVDRAVTVDGRVMAIADVLGSKELCGLLSDEGVISSPRQPGVP
jgi:hypothetical protein